jgi:hypothetical protein
MASLTSAPNVSNPSNVPPRTTTGQTIALTPSLVGQQFVKTYYDVLSKKPEHLFRFYKEDSQFTVATGVLDKASVQTAQGQEEIGKLVKNIPFGSCSYKISSVDSQGSSNGSIVVQVTGYIALEGSPMRNFAQTFVLNPQEKGFYVRNDILHMLQDVTTSQSQPVKEGSPKLNRTDVVTRAAAPQATQPETNVVNAASTLASPQYEATATSPMPNQIPKSRPVPATDTKEGKGETLEKAPAADRLQGSEDEKSQSYQQKKSWASVVGSKPSAPQNLVSNNMSNHLKQNVVTGQDSHSNREKASADERKGERPRERSGASVYISNFPKHLTEEMLQEEFSRYGKVLNVDLHLDRGFAFVDMESVEDVEAAVESWREGPPTTGPLAGMSLTVQQRKPSGGRGGRGGRESRGRGYGGGSRGGRNFANRSNVRRGNSGNSGEATRSGRGGGGRFGGNKASHMEHPSRSYGRTTEEVTQ